MTTYQNPSDHRIAQWLVEVGKTGDCSCDYEIHSLPGREDMHLVSDHYCPVHFPETSKILGDRP